MTPIDRHDVPVLQFSGGKDSLACLYLLRPYWNQLTVAWANSGDAFPETIDLMNAVRPLVHRFIEVEGDAPGWIAEHGWPVDVLPVRNSFLGRLVDWNDGPLLQPFTACCGANIWGPLQAEMRRIGATLVIRGQRNSEETKSIIRSGAIIEGVEYWFPLEDWSENQVFAYLDEQDVEVPSYYQFTGTGLDCMHCTAWVKQQARVHRWMSWAHPQEHAIVADRLYRAYRAAAVELHEVSRVVFPEE